MFVTSEVPVSLLRLTQRHRYEEDVEEDVEEDGWRHDSVSASLCAHGTGHCRLGCCGQPLLLSTYPHNHNGNLGSIRVILSWDNNGLLFTIEHKQIRAMFID